MGAANTDNHGDDHVCTCRPQPDDLRAAREILERYADQAGGLVPVLQEVMRMYGHLPRPVLEEVARARTMPLSEVYGVATFYAQFKLQPTGDTTIKICHGTACHVADAPEVTVAVSEELGVRVGGTTDDHKYTLESVSCLGCCGLAPVMVVGEQTFGPVSPKQARLLVAAHRGGGPAAAEAAAGREGTGDITTGDAEGEGSA